ncbi:MAG: PilZ domain-containing protein [Nitrospiraceae bacterium]
MLLRVRVGFEGEASGHEVNGEGYSTDLNVTGCSVESSHGLSPGIYLSLRIYLPDSARPVNVTLARVRWINDASFGVEFIQLPHNDQLRLNELTLDALEGEATSVPQPPLSPQTGRYTILLVDDDPAMLHLCRTLLARDGFNVIQASGSTEAMAICAQHVGDIHVALVDVLLQPPAFRLKPEKGDSPRVNGHTLVKGLTAKLKGLRTIMMSTSSKAALANNGIDLSDVPFLLKPFSHEKMMTLIRQQLENRTQSVAP